MVRRGTLTVPVIGVAKASWTLDLLPARAQQSAATGLLAWTVVVAILDNVMKPLLMTKAPTCRCC